MGDTAGPGDRSGLPGGTAAEPSSAAWVGEGLRWRLRHSPRLSRLVTAIELFAPELEARRPAAGRPQDPTSWTAIADEHLRLARAAANDRRLDDGWDFLHSAQRQILNALTRAEAADAVVALEREAAAKLVGWRREAAATTADDVRAALGLAPTRSARSGRGGEASRTLGDPAAPAPPEVCAGLILVKRLVDENSSNAYLRLRLVGQRLLLSTVLLGILLVVLGILVAAEVLDAAGFEKVTVLREAGTYTTIALLGMLGALLSFAIGAMATGADRRIYELASGRFAATAARILVGAAAAVVVATAVQSGVVGLNGEWLPMLAVAAGFSERLVKRIIESLSADAEKPRSSSTRAAKEDADPPGT